MAAENMSYEEAEIFFGELSKLASDFLVERGEIGDYRIRNQDTREKKREMTKKYYHNTMQLLENYRDIMWAMECIPDDIRSDLDARFSDIDKLISKVDIEMSLENLKVESRLRTLAKSRILVGRLNEAIEFLKRKPNEGEMLYSIIYTTYIGPKASNVYELFDNLGLTKRRYYLFRNRAISLISLHLWSAPDAKLGLLIDLLTMFEGR